MRIYSLTFFVGTLILLGFYELPAARSLVICMGAMLVFSSFLYFKAIRATIIPVIILFMGFAWAYWQASLIINNRIPQQLEGKDLLVEGVIADIPVYNKDNVRFVFEIRNSRLLSSKGNGVTNGKQTPVIAGRVRIAWYRDFPTGIRAGEHWQLQIRAKQPNGFMNPGGLDYEKWLFTQRIIATAYVRRSGHNRHLDTHFSGKADRIRSSIKGAIRHQLGETPASAIISALAVAWRHGISKSQWETLRRTGTSHLVAVSGLHIGLVAGFGVMLAGVIWWLFPGLYLLIPTRIAGGMLGAALACAYAILAGLTLPTQRALMMVLIIMTGLLLRRSIPFTVTLSTALLAVLLLDPLAGLSPGFWLSFLSVLMIFLLSRRNIAGHNKWLIITLQLGLSLGMIPLTAGLFGEVSLVSAPANLVAVPFVSLLVVPVVLVGVILLPLSDTLAGVFWHFAANAVELLFWFLDRLAGIDWAALHLPQLPLPWVLTALAGFALLILPRGIPGRWVGLVLLTPLMLWQVERPANNAFRLTVLDVGQGLASVIQTTNHVLVFDAGPKPSDSFDAGESVVMPWLRAQGYRELDTLLVSHADNDHSGGAETIMSAMPVGQLLNNASGILTGHKSEPCLAGKQWQWDDVQFEIMHPTDSFEHKKRNNRSCVLRVSNPWHSVLLAADIERPAEYAMSKRLGKTLSSEVLLVPHHGSKSSSSPPLLKKVEPEFAIVSAGYRNRFHHPHPSVTKRYKDWGIPLISTVDSGAIQIDFPADETGFSVHRYRRESRRFWNRR